LRITPLDIRKQEFRKAFRGFDCEEVEAFLDIMADEFEKLTGENLELREKVRNLEGTLAEYRKLEETLRDTLVTAQKTTDQVQQNAKREAELILKDAELKAEQIVEEARRRVSQISAQIAELRSQRDSLIAKLRAICNSQIELLESFEEEASREGEVETAVGAPSAGGDEVGEMPFFGGGPEETEPDEDQGEGST